MEETKCGQCGEVITDSSIAHEDWVQCFDCYCEEYEHIYNDQEESYADFYCRTSCSCCAGNDHDKWYDDEEE